VAGVREDDVHRVGVTYVTAAPLGSPRHAPGKIKKMMER